MPLKWTFNQTQAKNTPFKGLDIPAVFFNALWLLWKCSEKTLRLESALEDWWSCLMACDRPSHTLQHLLTRIQRFLNFLEIFENFQILGHSKAPNQFLSSYFCGVSRLYHWKFARIPTCSVFKCVPAWFSEPLAMLFSQSWAISFCVQNFRWVCTNSNGRQTEGKRPTHLSPWTGWL